MTLFLEERGWVLDLAERFVDIEDSPASMVRAVALRMTFEGDVRVPKIVGEQLLSGRYSYFLGADESRWRTDVQLYSSVCYENLYSGIDLRLRQADGVPEYDLLLQPGADLSLVTVRVEGADGLSISSDGSLTVETPLGTVTQPVPKTWQTKCDGSRRDVGCSFVLLGRDRFGFAAPGWDRNTSLTIDPGLIWSTFLGGSGNDYAQAVSVRANGEVTVAGQTPSPDFPTTSGAYDKTYEAGDAFVSRLDPRKTGSAQLVYSTLIGGGKGEHVHGLTVDASGTVTVVGRTESANFPTTGGAYDTTHNGGRYDLFVSRLDMGVALYGDVHEISIRTGGTQRLTVNAGKANQSLRYWIFGSMTGTKPGLNLPGVQIPLNPDPYTGVAMRAVNSKEFTNFRGSLNAGGSAIASFNLPANLPVASGLTFHHACVIYDASGRCHMASNAVPVRLK